MLKTIDKYNISTWFVYPLLGLPSKTDDYLNNTYLYSEELEGLAEHLHIVLCSPDDHILNQLRSNEHYFMEFETNKDICVVMEIPDKFTDDYNKIVKGEYSKISNQAKKMILVRFPYKTLNGILSKTDEQKEAIKSKIGEEHIDDSAELWSKIDEEKEILTFEMYIHND